MALAGSKHGFCSAFKHFYDDVTYPLLVARHDIVAEAVEIFAARELTKAWP
jgi:hypothetical protein